MDYSTKHLHLHVVQHTRHCSLMQQGMQGSVVLTLTSLLRFSAPATEPLVRSCSKVYRLAASLLCSAVNFCINTEAPVEMLHALWKRGRCFVTDKKRLEINVHAHGQLYPHWCRLMDNYVPSGATSWAIVFLLVPPHGHGCSSGAAHDSSHILQLVSAQTGFAAQLWMHIECQLTASSHTARNTIASIELLFSHACCLLHAEFELHVSS